MFIQAFINLDIHFFFDLESDYIWFDNCIWNKILKILLQKYFWQQFILVSETSTFMASTIKTIYHKAKINVSYVITPYFVNIHILKFNVNNIFLIIAIIVGFTIQVLYTVKLWSIADSWPSSTWQNFQQTFCWLAFFITNICELIIANSKMKTN